jgi:hypothetical protein
MTPPVSLLTDFGDVQVPLLAAMLLGGCTTKAVRMVRGQSISAVLGPTVLFPVRLRHSVAVGLCVAELAFGLGLIATAGRLLSGASAEAVRFGTGLLFVVATCALIELRSVRPDIGCGCFGEFSSAPITGRIVARSAGLAFAALAIVKLPPIQPPGTVGRAALVVFLLAAEVGAFAALSPELHDVLVRIGYSEPCEYRVLGPEVAIAAIKRSAQWRKHASLIVDAQSADTWRELCWRYVVFPGRHRGRSADLVFAVYLGNRRPAVLATLVDSTTGAVLPWPSEVASRRWRRARSPRARIAPHAQIAARAQNAPRARVAPQHAPPGRRARPTRPRTYQPTDSRTF